MPLLDKIVDLTYRIAHNDNNPENVSLFVDALQLYEKTHGVPHTLDASLPDLWSE